MSDFILILGLVTVIAVPVVAFVVWRSRQWQPELPSVEESVEESIAAIRNDALMMIQQLQGAYDRHRAERPEETRWMPDAIEFYRRLEDIASSPNVGPEEIERLAEEASRFVQEHRLKGIFVGLAAQHLAELVRRRDAA